MGENQGMVWIILGVIIVGAIVMALGTTMKGKVSDTNDQVSNVNVPSVTPPAGT